MNSGKEELKRSDLIEHVPTCQFFRVFGGDPDYSHHISAFYVGAKGLPFMSGQPPGSGITRESDH